MFFENVEVSLYGPLSEFMGSIYIAKEDFCERRLLGYKVGGTCFGA